MTMDEVKPELANGRQWTVWLNRLGPVLALLAIYGLFAALVPLGKMDASFLSATNLLTMARQSTIVGTAALGATLIIICAGIDLSVGSAIALTTMVIAALLTRLECSAWTAALGGIGAGIVCGLINGALITSLRVVPFIVTLGTLLAFRGVAKAIGDSKPIYADESALNRLMQLVTERDPVWMQRMILPPGVWIFLIVSLLAAGLLRYTRLGRHIFAVGSNEQTARLCGIAVNRLKLYVYGIAGFFAGLAGLMQYSRLTIGDPTVAQGLELDVIAAVVIGGGSLSGGEGSILGTIVGALIMAVIRSGSSILGLDNWVQEILTGTIIVAAVALDRLRHRRVS